MKCRKCGELLIDCDAAIQFYGGFVEWCCCRCFNNINELIGDHEKWIDVNLIRDRITFLDKQNCLWEEIKQARLEQLALESFFFKFVKDIFYGKTQIK